MTLDISEKPDVWKLVGKYCYERNPYAAPVRRLWVLVCTALMGDLSSMTAAGWRSLKKSLEAEVAMGIPERPRSRNIQKGSLGLNRGHLPERLLFGTRVESSKVERIQSSSSRIVLYLIAV